MKSVILITFILLFNSICNSQDIINSYIDYEGQPINNLTINNYSSNSSSGSYNGEYEILLDQFPWGNQGFIEGSLTNPALNLDNFALSYQIEIVSFPFAIDCAFASDLNLSGGCRGMINRVFTLPEDAYYNIQDFVWNYPDPISGPNNSISNKLYNKTPMKPFQRSLVHTISDPSFNNSLVSLAFGAVSGASIPHTVLPHSIFKHTINIHCGIDINLSPIISSFSFYVDLTRGRMREYPFRDNTTVSGINIVDHDLLIRPQLILTSTGNYELNSKSNCNYSRTLIGGKCFDGITIDDLEGVTINYTPFDPSSDDFCASIPTLQNVGYGDSFYTTSYPSGKMHGLPLADHALIAYTSIRNFDGTTLAGYKITNGLSAMEKLVPNNSIVHQYTIDKNINLEWINPVEKIIYNPSEVNITTNNLYFPPNYTFKTIRATFPFESEVVEAESDPKNGGPFTDPTKQDVPVKTDLVKEFHVSSVYDPTNTDSKFASLYHLMNGSKLTVGPCVKIFDATFEVNSGSEIEFENWSTNQINIDRYQLLFNGGTISKRNESYFFQNRAETLKILKWKANDFITAGEDVDPDPSSIVGQYSIEAGSEVSFIAGNSIDLMPGFEVKSTGDFFASIEAVAVPACPPFKKGRNILRNQIGSQNSSEIVYFTCSPNPTSLKTYFMFELNRKSKVTIKIFNSQGVEVSDVSNDKFLPEGKYSNMFNVENLSAGLYLARLQTELSESTVRFIKQ